MTAQRDLSAAELSCIERKGNSRREFLISAGTAGLALVGVLVPRRVTAGKAVGSVKKPTETSSRPTKKSFEAAIGKPFKIHLANGLQEMTLTNVIDNGSSSKLEQFTAVFQLQRSSEDFVQDVYEIACPGNAGKMALLLSPGSRADVVTAAFCNLN